ISESASLSSSLRPVLIAGSHAANPIDLNTHDQPLLSGPPIRILVCSKKTFGKLVNMRLGTRVGDSPSAVKDRVCLRVVAVLHRDNHTRIATYVVGFPSSLSRVEEHFVTLDVHPNHRELRLALSIERYNVTISLILKHSP